MYKPAEPDISFCELEHYGIRGGARYAPPGEAYGEGTANFAVLAEWNKSEVYRKTIVLYAQKLAGKSK